MTPLSSKLTRKTLLCLIISLAAFSAQADTAFISMSDAIQRLDNSGYTIEGSIDLVGTNYSAIVQDSSNRRAEVTINALNGEVSFVRELPSFHISWLDAANLLQQQGYKIISLQNKEDHYRATILDAQNHKADVEVDKVTGKVIPHVFD
jgi:uncharacterized membrane protein YkoI